MAARRDGLIARGYRAPPSGVATREAPCLGRLKSNGGTSTRALALCVLRSSAMPVPAPRPPSTPSRSTVVSGIQPRGVGLPEIGEIVGRYRIIRAIGAGGMGTVFEAEHIVLEKRVALKVLRPELAVDAALRKRFVHEGLAASRVRHPHVVDVTDAADENGRAYLVMELLEGRSLYEELVAHGPFDVATTLEMVLPICSALAVAHAVGVMHRDVKPENVFLVDGPGNRILPKLMDFGISDMMDGARDENAPLAGTPHYMAPEQVTGHSVDGHADQYAVGVMIFELLTGRLPYEPTALDGDAIGILREVASGRVHRLADALPDAPAKLVATVARMTLKDPSARFATMDRVGRTLMSLASPRTQRHLRDLIDPGWSKAISFSDVMAAMAAAPAPDLSPPAFVRGVLGPLHVEPSVMVEAERSTTDVEVPTGIPEPLPLPAETARRADGPWVGLVIGLAIAAWVVLALQLL